MTLLRRPEANLSYNSLSRTHSMRTLDLTGHRYGLLKVIAKEGRTEGARPEYLWRCLCDCGCTKVVRQNNLRSGHTKSCGCHMRKVNKAVHTKHGMKRSSTYTSWCQMKARCHSPNSTSYANYGAIGIAVCDKWRNSFEAFLKDMGEKPASGYSIERIDNKKGYFPENCRWATAAEQNRNYSRNIVIEYNGRKQCMKDWAVELKMHPSVLRYRLKAGWSVEQAFYTPVKLGNKILSCDK